MQEHFLGYVLPKSISMSLRNGLSAESNVSRNLTKCYYKISINSLAVLENLGSIPLHTSAQPEKTDPENYAFIWRQYAECDAKRNVRCISGDSEGLTHIRDGPILRCQLDARFCCMNWRFTMWGTLLQSLTCTIYRTIYDGAQDSAPEEVQE